MEQVKFGVRLSLIQEYTERHDFDVIKYYACECERLGYDSVWVMDQLLWGEKGPFECWIALAALASVTNEIRLGPFVTCNSFRNPALLAKMAATLDRISEGRLEFGIGAGWNKKEYNAYGMTFHKDSTRIKQMKEAIILIKKMWTEDKPSYKGKYYRIHEAICEPKPIQKPHPPILIGGIGEKLTLRVVAELADKSNFLSGSPEYYRHKLEVLKRHCKQVGRNFDGIVKTWSGDVIIVDNKIDLQSKIEANKPTNIPLKEYLGQSIVGTPDMCIKKLESYIDLGITYFIPSLRTMKDDLQVFSEQVMKTFS